MTIAKGGSEFTIINEEQEQEADDAGAVDEVVFGFGGNRGKAPPESRVGRKLSDLTTKRAIMLMLSIILAYPLLQYETYWQDVTAYETAAHFINLNRSGDLAFYV